MLYMCLVTSSFCRLKYGHTHINSRLNNTAEISKTKLSAVIEDLQTALWLYIFIFRNYLYEQAMNCLFFDLGIRI